MLKKPMLMDLINIVKTSMLPKPSMDSMQSLIITHQHHRKKKKCKICVESQKIPDSQSNREKARSTGGIMSS